jgi:hypothetical protein
LIAQAVVAFVFFKSIRFAKEVGPEGASLRIRHKRVVAKGQFSPNWNFNGYRQSTGQGVPI